jgi:hypothetical protein
MWAIRVLNGPQAGQVFKLKSGKNRLGRSQACEIKMAGNGISKEHLEIQIFSDKLVLTDLKSSNGTFLNGTRVQTAILKPGDRFGAHNILFEIVQARDVVVHAQPMPMASVSPHLPFEPSSPPPPPPPPLVDQRRQDPLQKFQNYVHQVLLPGIYHLTEIFEYRAIMLAFVGAFILIVTLLSIVPMKQITSESIQTESRRRAQTVARALANANEKVIRMGDLSNFSVDFVLREDGIDDVYIVSKDGLILAPPERAGSRPRDTKFIKGIQGQTKEIADMVDSDRVAAAYPIVSYDPEMQQNVPRAHAVVIFNIASLQFDDGRALGLFIQMLTIALTVGFILFYFLFKLVEYPLYQLNLQLDSALRESRDHAQIKMKFPILQELLVNLNSVLTRAAQSSESATRALAPSHNRDIEMQNLCQMVGYPCMILNRSGEVSSMNSGFESLIGGAAGVLNQNISAIPDQALQKNVIELMAKSQVQFNIIHSDEFEIAGHRLTIHCQALPSATGEIDYYVLTMSPRDSLSEGGAA